MLTLLPSRIAVLLIALAAPLWNMGGRAQAAEVESDADIERESENPVTRFYTLPLRYRGAFDDGFYGLTTDSFEISNAVIPVPLGDEWFLIARTKGAFLSQAPKSQGAHWQEGLNNAQTTLFLSPAQGDGFYWGVGPVISLPTATSTATGTNLWGAGPSVALSWQQTTHWTVALVTNNVWTLGSVPDGSNRSSSLLLNPIISYRFGDGWSLSTSPNITANWASKSGNRWTVPVGAGIGKSFTIGAQPMSLKFETYYNAKRPDRASIWAAQVTLTLLFPR
jgi:hypothetical protein